MFVFPPSGFRQDVQHRLPDPVLSQSAFSFQANVLQTVTDPLALLQQGELPARRLSRLLCEHLQGTLNFHSGCPLFFRFAPKTGAGCDKRPMIDRRS